MTPSFGFPYLVFNTKEGVDGAASRCARPCRPRSAKARCWRPASATRASSSPRATTSPRARRSIRPPAPTLYNERNANKAKEAAAEQAGYKGEPVRILTSRQYDFHYNMALLMAEQLKRAGFKADLNVVDWATLVQRRNDPKLWDIYVTHSGQFPEPMLSPPQLGDGAPGWWSSPAKKAALAALNQEPDPAKRGALWGKVQQVVYDEVPYINVGKFDGLSARARRWRTTADDLAVLLERELK